MAKSHWRTQAEEVVLRVLGELGPEATETQARKALRAAYPWGPKENHPYRIWCDVVRRAVSKCRHAQPQKADPVRYILRGDWYWAGVVCDWCSGKQDRGCMMCFKHHAHLEALGKDKLYGVLREALRLARNAEDAEVARAALLDWLEEHNVEIPRG